MPESAKGMCQSTPMTATATILPRAPMRSINRGSKNPRHPISSKNARIETMSNPAAR
jgi:hypothetical protein